MAKSSKYLSSNTPILLGNESVEYTKHIEISWESNKVRQIRKNSKWIMTSATDLPPELLQQNNQANKKETSERKRRKHGSKA